MVAVLAERAVVDLERGLRLREVLQRDERLAGVRVVEHRVTMAEGAALDVLAGQADRHAVGQDRRKRQLLRGGPVDRALVRRSRAPRAPLAAAFELLVERKPSGDAQQRVVDVAQPRERHARSRPRGGAGRRRFRHRLDDVSLRLQRA